MMADRRRVRRVAGRKDSSVAQFMDRVPRDVLDRTKGRRITLTLPAAGSDAESQATFTLGTFAKFSLQTRDTGTAEIRRSVVRADLAKLYDAVRRGPVRLTKRQIDALAGEVYRHLVREWGDDPGTPERWEAWKAFTRACLEGRVWDEQIHGVQPIHSGMTEEQAAARAIFGDDLTVGINGLPRTYEMEALEQRCGRLAHFILDQHHVVPDPAQRLPLLQEIARAALQAGWQLKRHSRGDWRPDPDATRFPTYPEPPPSAVTFDTVYKHWCDTENPAPSSRRNRRVCIGKIVKHLGRADMTTVTEQDVLGWRAAMLKGELAPSTVKVTLESIKAHFAYARGQRMIPSNPFAELRVTFKADNHPRKTEEKTAYDIADISRLIRVSRDEKIPSRRWLPLLSAATGARISELTQLWGQRVVEVDGIWMLLIRPAEDRGRLKNSYAVRDIPLHPAVIEAGFLDFVRTRGPGPIFYDERKTQRSGEKHHPSSYVSNGLGHWIRRQGFNDPNKSPNHACRHFFKTVAHEVGVDPIVANWLQGHRTPGEATRYRHVGQDRAGLYRAICAIPLEKALAAPLVEAEAPAEIPQA
ncbi:hypothetical protein SR39_01180 [Methylobacterium radiotolerans]|nr:hypothetical protein SR39_01180 [Methylobacterium radiotolerans]